MIITLRGADFSSNNINDMLNSYFITVQGSNLTDNLVDSVDKETNSGVSGTITINDGYVFDDSRTLVVKMGTQTLSGVANIAEDGKSITINISQKITGNVTITVPTKSVGGGEPVIPTNYTFTINPDPTSATVTLSATGYSTVSGTGSKSITVANGTTVNWSVSASGYTTRTGTWTINGGNKTENIALAASGGGTVINYFNIDSDEIIWGEAPAAGSTEPVTTANRGTSHYIAVSPGDKVYGGYYSPSTEKANYYKNSPVYLYDSNKTYKTTIASWTDADGKTDTIPRWITIPDGVAYMRCMLRDDPAPDNYKRDYQMITINQVLPDEFVPYNAG
jgi:hypothetical protein